MLPFLARKLDILNTMVWKWLLFIVLWCSSSTSALELKGPSKLIELRNQSRVRECSGEVMSWGGTGWGVAEEGSERGSRRVLMGCSIGARPVPKHNIRRGRSTGRTREVGHLGHQGHGSRPHNTT